MPEGKALRILKMQAQRLQTKSKNTKYLSHKFSLTVLGSGTIGGSPSLYVGIDRVKYLFNCGEGTQRLAHEYKQKLGKVEHLLVTNASWRNLGGAPGMILTLQNDGVPELSIHGPGGSVEVFKAMQKFVSINNLRLNKVECNENIPYQDPYITIWYVPITKSSVANTQQSVTEINEQDDTDYYAYENVLNRKRKLSTKKTVKKVHKIIKYNSGIQSEGIMSYICRIPGKPGKLNLNICVEKGVPPGPLMGQLKAGNDITLPDGTSVKSSEVCEPPGDPQFFLVVECPSEEYLNAFINHPAFAKHQALTAPEKDIARYVVHFSPPEIMINPIYKDWMKKFGLTTEHLIINEANNNDLTSEAILKHQCMLHLIHPKIFPMFGDISLPIQSEEKSNDDQTDGFAVQEDSLRIHQGKTMDSVTLSLPQGLNTQSVVFKPKAYIDEALNVEGFLDALAELQTAVNARTKTLTDVSEYPKIIMLGTGSSIPNKTRNTSAILLRINETDSILLDCGEGTLGQIIRYYGISKAKDILCSIKAVYISHLHADHHIGFIGLLQGRQRYTDEPLYLLAPKTIELWLRFYDLKVQTIFNKFIIISNDEFTNSNEVSKVVQDLYNNLNIKEIKTTHVHHCHLAYGVSITLKDEKKIVYSGDTMPCKRLVEIGKECDLLIHEATMEDALKHEAQIKRHSTFSEAIDIGVQMDAKFILLTHFSQRYAKIPLLPEHEAISKNVGIALDNMECSLSQLPLLPLFYPALKVLFGEFIVLLQKKVDKRQNTAIIENQ